MITQVEMAKLLLGYDAKVRQLNIETEKNYLRTLESNLAKAKTVVVNAKEIVEIAMIEAKEDPTAEKLAILKEAQENYAQAQRKYQEYEERYSQQYQKHDEKLKKLKANDEEGECLYNRISRHWNQTRAFRKPPVVEEKSFLETIFPIPNPFTQ